MLSGFNLRGQLCRQRANIGLFELELGNSGLQTPKCFPKTGFLRCLLSIQHQLNNISLWLLKTRRTATDTQLLLIPSSPYTLSHFRYPESAYFNEHHPSILHVKLSNAIHLIPFSIHPYSRMFMEREGIQ